MKICLTLSRHLLGALAIGCLSVSLLSCGGSGGGGSDRISFVAGAPLNMRSAAMNAAAYSQQVGYGDQTGGHTVGLIFSGDPNSATVLDPPGYDIVFLNATDGTYQGGA